MRRSDLCDYSNVYTLVSGTMTVTGAEADDHEDREHERNEGFLKINKNFAPFTECVSNI